MGLVGLAHLRQPLQPAAAAAALSLAEGRVPRQLRRARPAADDLLRRLVRGAGAVGLRRRPLRAAPGAVRRHRAARRWRRSAIRGEHAATRCWRCFAVVAGIGNGVFHPVDYTLLNRKVHPSRLGHAFSVHGITGSLGWALAPAMMVPITLAFGWRVALASRRRAGAWSCWCVLWFNRAHLTIDMTQRRQAGAGEPSAGGEAQPRLPDDSRGLDVLRLLLPLRHRAQRRAGLRARGGAPAARRAGALGGDVPDVLHGRAAPAAWCSAASSPPTRRAARRSSASASASPR